MTAYKGVNVTKYDNGGSGDNCIADGYIKSVEKVWMDSFAIGTTALTTADTITIATIPANKKITSVEVFYSTFAPTNCTIDVGISGDEDKFIKQAVEKTDNVVRSNNPDGFQYVTTAETDIIFSINNVASTHTNGTIATIVRYT